MPGRKKENNTPTETSVDFSRQKRGTRKASEYLEASPTGVADIVSLDSPPPSKAIKGKRTTTPAGLEEPETVFSSAKPRGRPKKSEVVSEPPMEIVSEPAIDTVTKSRGRPKKGEVVSEPLIVTEIKKGRAKKTEAVSQPTKMEIVSEPAIVKGSPKTTKKIATKPVVSRQSVELEAELPIPPPPPVQRVVSSTIDTSNFVNILTPENKRNSNFKSELAKLTRSDAHHDLKDVFKDTIYRTEVQVRNAFDSGIPAPAVSAYHEGEAFAAVILTANTDGSEIIINGHEEQLDKALDSVPDCTKEYNGRYSVFDIGVSGMPIFKYKVVRFVTSCSNNAGFKKENLTAIACKEDFGKKFVENVKLGEDGDEAAIIVDFSQHHFIEDLTGGTKTDFKVHYLMTPEVVNDPAGKPNVNNKSLFDVKETGVRLMSYVQSDEVTTTYTKFDESDPCPSNNFFSNYDFTLSPIKQIFTKQKAEKLITTLNIKYDVVPGKPLTDTIEDSKGENSITTVLGYLRKLLEQVKIKDDNAVKFNFNSKIQQKRGGDWFQALSCIDARNRIITEILPTRGEPTKLSPTCPVYLVTHDRIAVSFALLNGVNVIYLDYYGRIFIFKNTGDATLKSSGKPMEQILFEGIKRKWDPSNPNAFDLDRLLTTAQKYTTDRNQYLKGDRGKVSLFYNKCDQIKTDVESFTFEGKKNPIVDFQKKAADNVQKLFTAAVELEFIKINLIDVENDIRFIQANKNIFAGEYTEDIKTKVSNFSKALNNVKGIQDKFGVIPAQGDFLTAFDTWVTINIAKLDVYKCAKKILEETKASHPDEKLFDYNRLSTFYNKSHEGERVTDSHIFLPFIQDLDDISRDKMLDILVAFLPKLEQYIAINKATASSRSSRQGGLSATELFYNTLANLLYESFVFIEHSKVKNPEDINPIFEKTESLIDYSISTDNVLLRVDKMELDILRGPGKQSNYTDDVADETPSVAADSRIGGGYLSSFGLPLSRQSKIDAESVVCDISVKQIVWPLLTCVLLKNSNEESISEFIHQIRENIPDVITSGEEIPAELVNNPYIVTLRDKLEASSSSASSSSASSFGGRRRMRGGSNPKTYKAIMDLNNLADGLYTSQNKQTTGKNLMLNFKLGFHPLTPIYSMMSAYYNTIGPQSSSDPFFYTYFTYINVLEKMKSILETNYLNNNSNSYKTASAYLIGMGLAYMLLKSHTSTAQNKEILNVINMSQKEYSDFSLKNDSFTSVFSGAFHQDSDEEMFGMVCLNNKLFNNFINNQVNIKQILQQGTSVANLPSYEVLKERIFKLMGEIVVKVNADRGTPITSSTASGISGISVEERARRAALGQQKYEENVAKGLVKPQRETGIKYGKDIFTYSDTGIPVTSTTSTRSFGGRKRKITRKRRKAYKNKTLKRSRKNKKTRKHRRR